MLLLGSLVVENLVDFWKKVVVEFIRHDQKFVETISVPGLNIYFQKK
jgi:hypothetical protein